MSTSPYRSVWLQPDGSTRPGLDLTLVKARIAAGRRMYRREVRRDQRARSDLMNTSTESTKQRSLDSVHNARFSDPLPVVTLGCSLGAPQTSSKDLNPQRVVVDSVCPSKNMPSSTGFVEESTGDPHRSSSPDLNPTGVVDNVCPSKNMLPTIGSLEEYTPENLPRDVAGERECWITAGEECYNFYKAESAKVTMNADRLPECGIDGRISLQLDVQAVLAALPDVRKESDQQTFQAGPKLVVDSWLEDVCFTQDRQTLEFLSGSCQANPGSTVESRSQATEKYSVIPASAVAVQGLGQNDSPMPFKFYPATPQLGYPIHSNACKVLPDHISVESRSVQPLPPVRDGNFRVVSGNPMPLGLWIANHTITNRASCFGPALIPVLTSDWTENSMLRVPIPVQVYAAHPVCSYPASPQPHLTNPKDTTDIRTWQTEKSEESGRKPENRSCHSDQLFPLSASKESITTVAGSGADSNFVSGSEEHRTRSSKKRPHTETLPVIPNLVPDVYQDEDPLVKEKVHICKWMLGRESIKNYDGLEESVDHILSIHQRCQKERRPFHIHRECASKDEITAADCCWLKQFGSISPDDRRIKRSFQQMCTRVVNSAARNCKPTRVVNSVPRKRTYRISRFPDWINEEFKEFLKLYPKGMNNSLKEIKEVEDFAESLGLEYRQVINKLKHLRFDVAEDKRLQQRLQAKSEYPSCTRKSDREVPDATLARNIGPRPLLPRPPHTATGMSSRGHPQGHNYAMQAVSQPQSPSREIEAVYPQGNWGGPRRVQLG